ncbi:MAG: response regulator [Desulfobacteraceae bacterium]|nr:response regulator [Desulfobacteraceae bacterium]
MDQTSAPKTILIVEDELGMRFFLMTLLETNGYKVLTAQNGRQGSDLASSQGPDLIVLDVMMPQQGGILMYQHLKADPLLKQIPVVMLSAVSAQAFSHALSMLRSQSSEPLPAPEAYLEKPPDPDRLLRTIRQLI